MLTVAPNWIDGEAVDARPVGTVKRQVVEV